MNQVKRKKAYWYVAAIVSLAIVLGVWRVDSQAVQASQNTNAALPAYGGLITHVHDMAGRNSRVIVIDPQTRTMGVYDIGQENGEIQLKSVRRISADLKLLEFNSGEPSPSEIQSRLDQR
jgi:hypothetical protein